MPTRTEVQPHYFIGDKSDQKNAQLNDIETNLENEPIGNVSWTLNLKKGQNTSTSQQNLYLRHGFDQESQRALSAFHGQFSNNVSQKTMPSTQKARTSKKPEANGVFIQEKLMTTSGDIEDELDDFELRGTITSQENQLTEPQLTMRSEAEEMLPGGIDNDVQKMGQISDRHEQDKKVEVNKLLSPNRGAGASGGFIDLDDVKRQASPNEQETNVQPVSLEMRSSNDQ